MRILDLPAPNLDQVLLMNLTETLVGVRAMAAASSENLMEVSVSQPFDLFSGLSECPIIFDLMFL
jgi:hypothetical protein